MVLLLLMKSIVMIYSIVRTGMNGFEDEDRDVRIERSCLL